MLFLKGNRKQITKASLRAQHPLTQIFTPPIIIDKIPSLFKRVSCFTSKEYQGAVSVEAAISFSLFLFFLMNVLSLIGLFTLYGKSMEEMHQRGKQLAAYAYSVGSITTTERDVIRLYDIQRQEVPFALISAPAVAVSLQCVVKAWTGYAVEAGDRSEGEEKIVYVTDYGTVYHKSRSCTHLALSVEAVHKNRIAEIRNEGGGRYRTCEYCGERDFLTIVFITGQGDRYHGTLSCRSLKRSIREVYLSSVSLPACSKCG